jgi:hypothetical protein
MSFEAGDANLYRMTGNHPNMATDPSGLFEGGTQSSAEVQNEILQWMEVGRGAVSESDRRRVAAKLAQLQDIKSKLEEQERIAMRMVGKAVFDQSTGLGEWKEFDKKTGYLPFVHEGVDYIDGTAQNAVYIVSAGASDEFGITDTMEHVGWAWEGQRWAFGTSMVALELADGVNALQSLKYLDDAAAFVAPSEFAVGTNAGRASGRVVEQEVIEKLRKRLIRNGVTIVNDADIAATKLYGSKLAAFDASEDGMTATIYLRPDATRFEIAHELHHYTEWSMDKDAYVSRKFSFRSEKYFPQLARAESTLEAEQYVFDQFQRNDLIWNRLTPDEQLISMQYIRETRENYDCLKKRSK